MFKKINIPENRFNALETICTVGFSIGILLKLFQIPSHDYVLVVALSCLAVLYWMTAMSSRFTDAEQNSMIKAIRQFTYVSFTVSVLGILFYLMKWAEEENAKIMLLVCMGLILLSIVFQLIKKYKYNDDFNVASNITRAIAIEILVVYFYLLP